MSSGKRIVLSTFGSFGDIHPYVAIAIELKSRGLVPVIATSEVYREKMDAAGIEFVPIRPDMPSYDQPDEVTRLAEELIDSKTGSEKVLELFTRNLREQYEDLDTAVEGADLLLTHPLTLVGPIVAQKRKLPWVSSVLAPISLFSNFDPPILPQMQALSHLLRLSPSFSRFAFRLASYKLDKLMAPVYSLRAELGMPRGGQPLMAGQHSPLMVLALFSSAIGKPQPDWPTQTRQTGFPFYDRRDYAGHIELDPMILKFLDDGPPPIIFTLGSSAFWVAREFYRDSIKAAQALSKRALLLIGHQRNMPEGPLPEGVGAFEYAPFGEILPRALAIVHQGGVGTTGQALRAGRPQVILPHAHDQFDNAARVLRLGCGRSIPRPGYNAATAKIGLEKLLGKPDYFSNAKKIGVQVQQENGAATAADAIEEVLNA